MNQLESTAITILGYVRDGILKGYAAGDWLVENQVAVAVTAWGVVAFTALAVGGGYASHGHPVAGLVVGLVGLGLTVVGLTRVLRRR